YVTVVIATGVVVLVLATVTLRVVNPVHALVLLVLAIVASAAKISLPLGGRETNLSLSHAINFWALLTLSPAEAVLIAAGGATAQCLLRVREPNPVHRTAFSIATLAVTTA